MKKDSGIEREKSEKITSGLFSHEEKGQKNQTKQNKKNKNRRVTVKNPTRHQHHKADRSFGEANQQSLEVLE